MPALINTPLKNKNLTEINAKRKITAIIIFFSTFAIKSSSILIYLLLSRITKITIDLYF